MKQQVIIIHGGTTFANYAEYLSYLKNKEVALENFKLLKDWKESLEIRLGDNLEVLSPCMPDSTNSKYKEWKIWFERIFPFITNNVILIGHSLGGIFLAKYLSENDFPKTIKATILLAAPFEDKNTGRSLRDFKLPPSLLKLSKQGGKIYLIQSKDDSVVPFEHLAKYKEVLPNATEIVLDGRGHFKEESFPEIIKLIKEL